MDLRLQREPTRDGATLGCLFVDGHFECFTLEDIVRERPGEPVSAWKIPAETAIPVGRYRVVVTRSTRFQRDLPLLLDVPGFTGIRIHPGNGSLDTEGCLLVGRDRVAGRLHQSRVACEALLARLTTATTPVWIDIVPAVLAEARAA